MNNQNRKTSTARNYAQAIVNTIREPLLVLNKNLQVVSANNNFHTTFEVNKEETEGRLIYELGNNQWNIPALRSLLEEVLPEKKSIFDFEVSHDFESIGKRTILVNANQLIRETEEEELILLSFKDITQRLQDREKEKHHLKYFETVLAHAPAMICILRGPNFVYEVANDKYYQLVGQNREIIGKPVREALPEIEGQGFFELLDMVWETGEPYIGNEVPIKVNISKDEVKNSFIDFVYQPTFDATGKIDGIFVYVVYVTEQVLSRKKVEASEHRYQEMIHSSPSSIATFKGDDYTIEIANDAILEAWGRNKDVIGKPLFSVLPELLEQGFEEMLQGVYKTGKPYKAYEMPINLLRNGKMELVYFNFIYYPQRDVNGKIVGVVDIATEVTPQAELSKKIKESESHFRQMANLMPGKILNTDARGNATYFNRHWLDDTGLSFEELKSRGWQKTIHPRDFEEFTKNWKKSLATGNKFEMEFRCLDKNGEYNWHLSRASAVKNAKGSIEMWINATTNIQEQKEVMERLEYSKALMETHNQANSDGILLVDGKGKIISFNQSFIEIWNMPQHITDEKNDEAALEFAMKQLRSPDQFIEKVKHSYESPTGIDIDELKFKDGKIIERHGYPVVGKDGTFYAWSWTFRDITEQKNHEKRIKESEAHFRQMADLMPGKILNTDARGNATYFNQHWLDDTGLSFEKLKNRGWQKTIHPRDIEEFIKAWKKSLATGNEFEMEFRSLNKNGKYKWQLGRAVAVKDKSGKIKLWINSAIEIQKLKEEEKRKEDFLKMVSHELKTPVTSIKGYIQLLLSLLNGKDVQLSSLPLKPSLERIDHQVKRLTRLIAEMLDLSRIEENKLELQKENFYLNDLVSETVQDITYTNTQHKIEILHEFKCEVYADRDRIGQVLINFITNGIKYSPDSQSVQVKIYRVEDNRVAVSIRDKGIGIDKKDHKKIFKRFYRIGGKSEETYSGFGIGLYLANEIIQRHNGTTKVKSKLGEGAEFIFTLSVTPENENK